MLKNISEVRDANSEIKKVEKKMHRVRTLHSLGKLDMRQAKEHLRLLESELAEALKKLPSIERHYYYYKRLYGNPVKAAGKAYNPRR